MSRALVISCNYSQFNCRLYGCHNDADNFINTIRRINPKITIITMRDTMQRKNKYYPTKKNILRELSNLGNVKENLLFFFYSGHGIQIPDDNSDETSILNAPFGSELVNLQSNLKDSCLISNDINNLNFIKDDEICNCLQKLRSNQKLYAFSDSCFSGTLLDLYDVYGANYSTKFSSSSIDNLITEATEKCQITSSNYPNKLNQIKANVILISGTRDNAYSYESYVGKISRGHFTTQLVNLLNYGAEKLNLKQFYLTVVALLNDASQIPVLSSSLSLDIDNTMLTDLAFTKNTNKIISRTKVLLIKAKGRKLSGRIINNKKRFKKFNKKN